jgi:hypothetical protein
MSDDFMKRIQTLAERANAANAAADAERRLREHVMREHDEKPKPRPRPRPRQYARHPLIDKRTLEERLLMTFTPETAYRFIVEHTVPPATEDGLALLKLYPELVAVAPELCAQMALAFRYMARELYAAHFVRVAKYHGITP